ncbi:chromate transporter [Paenalcaligenes hominis]|uniref:chromate transporter n=1 Tax=Paenalcaligenes hominis TaxID=643674 RepID=UPI003524DBDA
MFFCLGLTSFGGSVVHLGFFRDEFLKQRAWLSECNYAELIALCQLLPGSASSCGSSSASNLGYGKAIMSCCSAQRDHACSCWPSLAFYVDWGLGADYVGGGNNRRTLI